MASVFGIPIEYLRLLTPGRNKISVVRIRGHFLSINKKPTETVCQRCHTVQLPMPADQHTVAVKQMRM